MRPEQSRVDSCARGDPRRRGALNRNEDSNQGDASSEADEDALETTVTSAVGSAAARTVNRASTGSSSLVTDAPNSVKRDSAAQHSQ